MTVPAPITSAGPTHRRASWHAATIASVTPETPNARRIVLEVPSWPGNDPGQHLDLRLTAEDGYQATRSYSIASWGADPRITLVVDKVSDGEVSAFLVDDLRPGDEVQVQGPLGGWFVWRPGTSRAPVQLIAGGSGIVPLLAMTTAHAASSDPSPFRLLYAVRRPEDVFFGGELAAATDQGRLRVDLVYSRHAPPGWPVPAGRLTRQNLSDAILPATEPHTTYVCGSTPFVEQVLRWLSELGHDLAAVRAERFGGAT